MLIEPLHIAVPTAFFKDESLNVQGTIDHIKYLYSQGIKSVLVCGSTGEQHSLNLREKIDLLNAVLKEEELINNMEVLFGVSSIRQVEAVELAKAIRNTKIAGILLGYPPYILPSQEEALGYSEKIIDLTNKPTILYNNPKRTGFDLSLDSIIYLSMKEFVIGIKEAGNKDKIKTLKNKIHSSFYYYAGGEIDLEDKVKIGFNRLSSISGNISPDETKKWFMKMLRNEPITEQENLDITNILQHVYTGSPLVNLKRMINEKGIEIGICRSPLGNI
ncbi:dihydrodipicolinate synthase family protein [Bacillus sp. FJAT-49732]|uniref:Dihydrodipicolinate synthase family protein n=1 Tax=Lederbergia citrisecunda TaxID=2833583 RepID=A0A942TNS9_9BACI|nr:dihydrodipicolinate synthase family protein [Lederbergia citrisecunda]